MNALTLPTSLQFFIRGSIPLGSTNQKPPETMFLGGFSVIGGE
jgi:hypothetical protein